MNDGGIRIESEGGAGHWCMDRGMEPDLDPPPSWENQFRENPGVRTRMKEGRFRRAREELVRV